MDLNCFLIEIKRKKLEKMYQVKIRKNTSDIHVAEDVFKKEIYKDLCIDGVKTIIDAGGNVGYTAIYFAKKYPQARIISIEPDADNFKVLRENTKPYPNIIPVNAGLWSDKKLLYIEDKGCGEWGRQTFESSDNSIDAVDGVTMDDILKRFDIQDIDILKIDIEGAEIELFKKNYDQWLPKVRILGIELHDRMIKGCSNAFFKALSNYPEFELSLNIENLVLKNTSRI